MSLALTLLNYHLVVVLVVLLVLVFVSNVLQQGRPPSSSMAWIIFIITLPYLAIPLYLAIGARKLASKAIENKRQLYQDLAARAPILINPPADRLLYSYHLPPPRDGNQVRFHADGRAALHDLLGLIDTATHRLDLCTFILADDMIGQQVRTHLIARARCGVQVRVLLDGVGSFLLPKGFLVPLKQAGVQIAWFIPVIHRPFKGRTNLRNHRKLLIADGCRVWSGGRNLKNDYFFAAEGDRPAWIDLTHRAEGPVASDFQYLFDADWYFATGKPSASSAPCPPLANGQPMRMLPTGPDIHGDPLYALLMSSALESRQRIVIVTPYYVPDDALSKSVCLAARKGTKVELILPQASNHPLTDIARNRHLRKLHAAGGRIYLLPERMIHAKLFIFDGQLALNGSANLDVRSLFLNFELMSVFYHPQQLDWLASWAAALKADAIPYQADQPGLLKRNLEGLVSLLSFQL